MHVVTSIKTSRLLRPALLAVCAGLCLSATTLAQAQPRGDAAPAAQASRPQIDLPIRRITLYRSGVGYFERSALIDGHADVTLRFTSDQINDILKSMVLIDLGGGRIDSVSYASKEPLAKRLASFGINIADNPAAGELLQRLRGTPVSLSGPEGEVSGTIMNVESRPTVYPGSGNSPATVLQLPWINLVTESGVRSVNLTNITGFKILDAALSEELTKALAALAEYRADRTKTVDLRFTGSGSRRVVVSYVNEMPVWKTSYRLVLPEKDSPPDSAGKPTGQLMLQGWAIVENTTDQDWNDVRLSLVSGRPVSFQMDLYEPLFAFRPMVPVPTIPGVNPRVFGLGIDESEMAERMALGRSEEGIRSNVMQSQALRGKAAAPSAAYSRRDAREAGIGGAADYAGVSVDQLSSYSPRAAAQAGSVGELFQFEVEAPVSIERQRSAMIPIISTNVVGRRVSIFNAADGSQFPMRGVEITNNSSMPLLPGPISVIEGAATSAYAGDAEIGQIPIGDKRMLAYALDLDMAVFTKPEEISSIEKIVIVDGSFRQTIRQRASTSYEFANKDKSRARTVILEHPIRHGFDLVQTDKPTEKTQDLYRFTVPVEAGKAKKFDVHQEIVRYETIGVLNWDMPTVVSFHKSGKMSDKVFEAYKQVAAKQAALAQTERQIDELNVKMKEIGQDQERIRENLTRIDRASQLAGRYMTKLTEQETQLEDMRERRTKAEAQRDQQRADLSEFVRTLTVGE